MFFKIQNEKEQNLNLTQDELFTQILAQAFKEKENEKTSDVEEFVSSINKLLTKLNSNNTNLDITLRQLHSIYFLCGYYYKVFLSKNNVKIEKEKQ